MIVIAIVKRLAAGALTVALAFGCATSALAYERDDIVDITYVDISEYGEVIDSLNGVDAYYNPWGYNYQCSEYVCRYYAEVYGLEIGTSNDGPYVIGNDDFWFEPTDEPMEGDIAYSPSYLRGKSYNHWAIVKSFDDGVATLIEQNWRWNGQAGFERQISYPGTCYLMYTLCHTPTEEEVAQMKADALKSSIVKSLDTGFVVPSSLVNVQPETIAELIDDGSSETKPDEVERTVLANSLSVDQSPEAFRLEVYGQTLSPILGALDLRKLTLQKIG